MRSEWKKDQPQTKPGASGGRSSPGLGGAGGGRSGGGARPQEVLSGAERGCGPDPPALRAPTRRRRPSLRSPRPVSAGGPGAGGEQGRTLREERGRMGRPRTASCCVPSCPPETPRLHFVSWEEALDLCARLALLRWDFWWLAVVHRLEVTGLEPS